MKDHKALGEALAKRKGHGIDISIMLQGANPEMGKVGGHEQVGPSEKEKSSDLAPEVKDKVAHEMSESSEFAAGEMEGAKEALNNDMASEGHDDSFLLNGMSEHDLQDMKQRKPRSLSERARMAAMDRKK